MVFLEICHVPVQDREWHDSAACQVQRLCFSVLHTPNTAILHCFFERKRTITTTGPTTTSERRTEAPRVPEPDSRCFVDLQMSRKTKNREVDVAHSAMLSESTMSLVIFPMSLLLSTLRKKTLLARSALFLFPARSCLPNSCPHTVPRLSIL